MVYTFRSPQTPEMVLGVEGSGGSESRVQGVGVGIWVDGPIFKLPVFLKLTYLPPPTYNGDADPRAGVALMNPSIHCRAPSPTIPSRSGDTAPPPATWV